MRIRRRFRKLSATHSTDIVSRCVAWPRECAKSESEDVIHVFTSRFTARVVTVWPPADDGLSWSVFDRDDLFVVRRTVSTRSTSEPTEPKRSRDSRVQDTDPASATWALLTRENARHRRRPPNLRFGFRTNLRFESLACFFGFVAGLPR